ncbi:hypothetical protein AACH10_11555 [Ideonella sp. DXS22W]|uniref:DUF3035 domain-containing protein n=1 Tax=Pseudaquabacterium inlustre TaxID=2984192 RepID=A0ABU9CG80_9BURK
MRRAARVALLVGGSLALLGCASREAQRAEAVATSPLVDLNLMQTIIPEVLQAAQKSPYGPPDAPLPGSADARGCLPLQAEIDALDEALGPDLDAPPNPDNPGLIERGTTLATDAAFGALQRTVEGVVPFRGWVRKLSGAERRSRQVAAAIAAGGVRRGFLKGLRQARGCPVPAPPSAPAASAPGVAR